MGSGIGSLSLSTNKKIGGVFERKGEFGPKKQGKT